MKRLYGSVACLLLIFSVNGAMAGGADQYTGATAPVESDSSVEAEPWSPAASNASDDLRSLLGNLESLEANFDQRVVDADGYEIQAMSGQMTVARPGKIHWQTRPPYEQLLISDAETLWLYDKDLEQVTVRPFLRDIVNSPAMLFIGDLTDLESRYRVARSESDQGISEFTLVPNDSGAVYRKLTVGFAGELPTVMVLWDSLGQMTQIEFSEVKLNPDVADSQFVFTIPDGADVLYND